jgi:hypothetical protein
VAVRIGKAVAVSVGRDPSEVGCGPYLVVLWADPGITTGWCVLKVPIAELLRLGQVGVTPWLWYRVGQFRHDTTSASVDSYLSLARVAWDRSSKDDIVVIGCEDFSLQMLSTDRALLEPVRFLSVLVDRLRGTGVGVETQMPGERSVITDARFRLWDMWVPAMDHGRDAFRHSLVFLRRFAGQEMLRKRLGWEG